MKRSISVGIALLVPILGVWYYSTLQTNELQVESTKSNKKSRTQRNVSSEPTATGSRSTGFKQPSAATYRQGSNSHFNNYGLSSRIQYPPPDVRELRSPSLLTGTTWQVWEGVKIVPRSEYRGEEVRAQLGKQFVIGASHQPTDFRNFVKGSKVVVYNERLNSAGLVTGVFNLKMRTSRDMVTLSKELDLLVTEAFPAINRYFVTSNKAVFNLETIQEQLQNSKLVTSVTLEIVSKNYEHK